MVASLKEPVLAEFQPGAVIVFEFARIRFWGIIDDASDLDTTDRLKVTFYHASDSKFNPHLPKQLWVTSVSGQIRALKLYLADAAQWLLLKAAAA